MIVVRDDIRGIVDRHISARRPRPAQVVDELVACDRVDPGRERLARIIGVSPGVDGEQRLLHQIFRLRGATSDPREPALVVPAQQPAQPLEQLAMRRRVAVEAGNHQAFKFGLDRRHARLASLFANKGRLVTNTAAQILDRAAGPRR